MCGYLPFEDPNTAQLYKKILLGEFKCAKWVSTEARDLLKKVLNTNPEERYSIEQIKQHPWTLISNNRSLPIIDRKIEEKILELLPNYGIDSENAKKHLEMKKHNHITATYFLLAKKILEKPGKNEVLIAMPVKEINRAEFSRTNNAISRTDNAISHRRNSARKYSVTPSRGGTSRIYTRPQEPVMPKPSNIPQRISN